MRAFAFDLDGTLVDHDSAVRSAVTRWAQSHGWPTGDATVDAWRRVERVHFDAYLAGSIDFVEQRRRRVRDFMSYLGQECDEADVDVLFGEMLVEYEAGWRAYEDAAATLDTLAERGFRLAILTNGDGEQQRRKLERVGLLDRFDCVLASSELVASKPDSRAFGALCDALGLPPNEVAHVGDDPETDARGATAAGLRAFHIVRAGLPDDVDGVITIRTLAELLDHLE